MKKNLKGIIATASMIAMALTLTQDVGAANTVTATPSTHTFSVDGEVKPMAAYVINGNNYLKLRDIAAVVNGTPKQFEVGWDAGKNAINLTSNKAYTPNGSELTKGSGGAVRAQVSTAKVYKDSALANYAGYNIAGNNYYKLRDVAESFDIGVEWDGATMTSNIVTAQATGVTTVAVPDTAIKKWDLVMSKLTGELFMSNNPYQYPNGDEKQFLCGDKQKFLEIAKKFAPQVTGKSDGTVEEVIVTLDNVKNSPEQFQIKKLFGKTTAEFYADELRKALGQEPIHGNHNEQQNPAQTQEPETQPTQQDGKVTDEELRQMESLMIEAVNEERTKAGLPVYVKDDVLMNFAQYWAKWMASNEFRHSNWNDIRAYANRVSVDEDVFNGGQNITMGYRLNQNRDVKKVVQEAMKNLMDSPGHKAAILYDDCTRVGIGFAVDENGIIFCFQIFGFPLRN